MNMGAHLLPRLCSPEDSKDRDLRSGVLFGLAHILWQLRVECSRSALIIVDTVESDSECFHEVFLEGKLERQWLLDCMLLRWGTVSRQCT